MSSLSSREAQTTNDSGSFKCLVEPGAASRTGLSPFPPPSAFISVPVSLAVALLSCAPFLFFFFFFLVASVFTVNAAPPRTGWGRGGVGRIR